MATFFTDLALCDIKTAWRIRQRELQAQRLQMYNDLLFKHVEAKIRARREEIQDALLKATKEVADRQLISVPLWTYNVTVFPTWLDSGYNDAIEARQRAGDDDTIACSFVGTRARVRDVIQKTNFLARLSLIFGTNFHVRDWRGRMRARGDNWISYEQNLTLIYTPWATPDYWANRQQETVSAKYATHKMYPEAPVFRSGHRTEYPGYLNEDPDAYYLRPDAPPPGLSNVTPPPARPGFATRSNEGPPPPPRIMRSMNWGIDDRNPLEEENRAYDEAMDRAVAEFNRRGRLPSLETETESEGDSPLPGLTRCYCGN